MKIVVTVTTYDGDDIFAVLAESKEEIEKLIKDAESFKYEGVSTLSYKKVFDHILVQELWDSATVETLDEWWEGNFYDRTK